MKIRFFFWYKCKRRFRDVDCETGGGTGEEG